MSRLRLRLASLAFLCSVSCGDCNYLDKGGNSNEGRFQIVPKGPVAVGTTASFGVFDYERNEGHLEKPVVPKNVEVTTSAGTFEGLESNRIVVAVDEPGALRVEFEGRADKDKVKDGFAVQAFEPTSWTPLPVCPNSNFDVVVAGQPARLISSFRSGPAGPALLGAGWYPARVEPEGAATVNVEKSTQSTVVFDIAADAPEEIYIFSELGFAADYSVALRVVQPGDLGHALLWDVEREEPFVPPQDPEYDPNAPAYGAPPPVRKGQWRHLRVLPTLGGEPVCAAELPLRAEVKTKRKCRLGFGHDKSADYENGEFWIQFTGNGGCELDIAVQRYLTAINFLLEIFVKKYESSSGGSFGDDD